MISDLVEAEELIGNRNFEKKLGIEVLGFADFLCAEQNIDTNMQYSKLASRKQYNEIVFCISSFYPILEEVTVEVTEK